jgi:hypothetical protein
LGKAKKKKKKKKQKKTKKKIGECPEKKKKKKKNVSQIPQHHVRWDGNSILLGEPSALLGDTLSRACAHDGIEKLGVLTRGDGRAGLRLGFWLRLVFGLRALGPAR